MTEGIDINKRYCIVNENGQALEVDDWDSGLPEPHLGELKYKSNQIWLFKGVPREYNHEYNHYYIIHEKTNRILVTSTEETITIYIDKVSQEFTFNSIVSKDLNEVDTESSPVYHDPKVWIIFHEDPEKIYYKICSASAYDWYGNTGVARHVGLPKYKQQGLPPVVIANPNGLINNWFLKEVPDDPKPDDPKPDDPKSTITGILLSSPAYMIREMCSAIADSQRALDAAALETQKTLREKYPELADIGYQVTWYQIPEVTMEIKVAVHFEETADNETKFFVSPFNARYQSQFKFTGDGSSNIKLRVVPIPPPIGTEQTR